MPERLTDFDVYSIPTSLIWVDRHFNCRGQFTPDSTKELADSIQSQGLRYPLDVQPRDECPGIPEPYEYRLVAGFRRYHATTFWLKRTELPCRIRRGMSERDARLLNLTENLEREDLNPLEEARGIRRLYEGAIVPTNAAKELKRSVRWIKVRLQLLELPPPVQRRVAAGILTLGDVQVLHEIKGADEQIKAADRLFDARRKGRKPEQVGYPRRFRVRKNKVQISKMIRRLMRKRLDGFPTRLLAWCAGYVSDDEIAEDIRAAEAEA